MPAASTERAGRQALHRSSPQIPSPPAAPTWPSQATTFSRFPHTGPLPARLHQAGKARQQLTPPLHQGTQPSRLLASWPPFLLSMILNSESHKCYPTELYFQPLPYIFVNNNLIFNCIFYSAVFACLYVFGTHAMTFMDKLVVILSTFKCVLGNKLFVRCWWHFFFYL